MARKPKRAKRLNLRWSEAEDRRLIALVSEHAGNLSEAFRLFSEEFPARSFRAVMLRWYSVIRKRPNVNVCLLTIDKKHKHLNGKNIKTPVTSNRMRTSIWRQILNLLGL